MRQHSMGKNRSETMSLESLASETMKYELVNPSDPYTMASDDPAAAAVACMFLGNGAYALRTREGESACPLFILGGDPNATLKDLYGVTVGDVMRDRRDAVVAALRSVLIGGFSDREEFEAVMKRMRLEDAGTYRGERHDRIRTSMNNIGKRATALADHLEATATTGTA